MKNNQRLFYFDYLKCFIILLVLIAHVSITFMAKVPQWWYVKSSDSSMVFTLFVVIFDTFMMPVLFFISGYVLLINIKKNSVQSLLSKRFKRLGIPWIICTLLFSPFLSVYIAHETGKNISYIKMVTGSFWTEYYSQGPYWFLGILLSFTLIVLFIRSITKIRQFVINVSSGVIWLFVPILSFVGYTLGTYFFGMDTWINNLYIWSFQPSRILTYFVYFSAGYLLSEKNWILGSGLFKWIVIGLISSVGYLVMKGKTEAVVGLPIYIMQGFFYSIVTLSISLFLLGFFAKKLNKPLPILTLLSRHSFVVYLVHLPIQTFIAKWIVSIETNIMLRFVLLSVSVLLLSLVVSSIFNLVKNRLCC